MLEYVLCFLLVRNLSFGDVGQIPTEVQQTNYHTYGVNRSQ